MRPAVVAAVSLVFGVATPASAAGPPLAELSVGKATIAAGGAAVDFEVTVHCTGGANMYVEVEVQQKSRKREALGTGSVERKCLGKPEIVLIHVDVGNLSSPLPAAPYKAGPANFAAKLWVADWRDQPDGTCGTVITECPPPEAKHRFASDYERGKTRLRG